LTQDGAPAMSKVFYVEPGYEALTQGAWHGAGLLLWVEPGGNVEVFQAPGGKRAGRIGAWDYAALDADSPPPGLRPAKRDGTGRA
jgi:hypothetical protein